MNWELLTAIIALLTLLLTIAGLIFLGGKMAQKLNDNCEDTAKNTARLDEHTERLGVHEVSLGRLHEWKDGFNAGARSSGGVL